MKSKVILAIGILAIVIGVATTGIAVHSVQAATSDPGQAAKAAKKKKNVLDGYSTDNSVKDDEHTNAG